MTAFYLSSLIRWEHNFGVYRNVFGGGLFNGTIADKIYRVISPEILTTRVTTSS